MVVAYNIPFIGGFFLYHTGTVSYPVIDAFLHRTYIVNTSEKSKGRSKL